MLPTIEVATIEKFSKEYSVRRLEEQDTEAILSLCSKNPLYYQYCPPFVTKDGIFEDMHALPPNKDISDKYYVGYFFLQLFAHFLLV